MKDQPEVVAEHGKMAVVELPGRRFPGIWIPADTLSTWLATVDELALTTPDAHVLAQTLRATINTYVADMESHARPLPFAWPRANIRDST